MLYGASMGAAAVLRAAVGTVAPRAVVLEAPFDRLVTTVVHRFEAMGFLAMLALPGAAVLVFWGSVDGGFNGFAHNPADYAARVAVPTLVHPLAASPVRLGSRAWFPIRHGSSPLATQTRRMAAHPGRGPGTEPAKARAQRKHLQVAEVVAAFPPLPPVGIHPQALHCR